MRELTHRTRLPSESRYEVATRKISRVEDLDGDKPVHVRLLGAIDGAHPAFPYLLHNAELASDLFAQIRIAHGARLALEMEGCEESASMTSVIHIASAMRRWVS